MTLSVLVGLLALCSATEEAPYASVSVSLSPPVIPFHHQARLTITVEAPADAAVHLPDIAKLVGGLGLVGPLSAPETTLLKDARRRIATSYYLDAIWVGDYPLGPVTVRVGQEQITVPGPVLRVRDLTPEETEAAMEFAPNAGPMDPEIELLRAWWFWVLCAVLVGGGCAGAGFYVWRKRSAGRIAPPRPAWEVAYARLASLDARRLPESGDFETYYVELSSILRHYIEDRFEVRAPEETTPEFLAEASSSGLFSEAQQRLLAGFLRHADRVKFAQYEPTLAEMERAMTEVLQFVDETIPAPEPEQEAAA